MTTATVSPFDRLKSVVESANAIGQRLIAVNSDKSEAINAILDTSDDPALVAFREAYAKGLAQIEAAQAKLAANKESAKAHAATLLPEADADFDKEKAQAEFLTLRREATNIRKALELILGEDAVKEGIESNGITEVVSVGKTRGASKGASGIVRPRISAASVNGKDVSETDKKGNVKTSFTLLTKALNSSFENKVTGEIVREAAFSAAGTKDLSSLPAGTVVDFVVNVGDESAQVSITTQGKPSTDSNDEAADEVTEAE